MPNKLDFEIVALQSVIYDTIFSNMLGIGVYSRGIESIVNDCTTDMVAVDMIIREWMYYK